MSSPALFWNEFVRLNTSYISLYILADVPLPFKCTITCLVQNFQRMYSVTDKENLLRFCNWFLHLMKKADWFMSVLDQFFFSNSLVSHVRICECPELLFVEFQKTHRRLLWNQLASKENCCLGSQIATSFRFQPHSYHNEYRDIIQRFIVLLKCDGLDCIFSAR